MVNASRGSLLRFRYQLIGPLVLGLAAACLVIPRAQADPAWTSTDKWGSYSDGGYRVSNSIWGDGAGPQTIWANSYRSWGVQADHPAGGSVRSYPNVAKDVGKKLGELNKLTSSYGVKVPSGGVYNTAYDIWADGQDYEIMIWVAAYGGSGPISQTDTTKTDVGGDSWTVHRGTNGSTRATISFVRDSNSTSGTVDILAILKYAQQQGWFGDITVTSVSFGWEICSSPGGMEFEVTDFNVDYW